MLSLAHEGHLGIIGTKQKLGGTVHVWWPGTEKDAEKYCKTCYGCQLVIRHSPPELIRVTVPQTGSRRDLAVDLLGPLPPGESILVAFNYNYSRYYEVDILKCYYHQKNNCFFFFGFQNYVNYKHQTLMTQVLSSDFKKTPVYFKWNFLIYWSVITKVKILREPGRGESDVKDSLV